MALPRELRESLSPLEGLCTYKLLDDIRYDVTSPVDWDTDTVSDTIGDWFSQLQDCTRAWGHTPLREDRGRWGSLPRRGAEPHGWRSMGEELLALDAAIRVPPEAPETRDIYTAVSALPRHVMRRIGEKYPDVTLQLRAIGSFPADAKIIDIDEFDFLVICDLTGSRTDGATWRRRMMSDFPALLRDALCAGATGQGRPEVWNVQRAVAGGRVTAGGGVPRVRRVYPHGPAHCVELFWTCTSGHVHELGVDVTFAYRHATETLRSHVSGLQGKPVFGAVYAALGDAERALMLPELASVSTCLLDGHISGVLRALSPHVLACYRLLKYFVHELFPSRADADYTPYALAAVVDSYTLKQILYVAVERHPRPRDWDVAQLHHRLAELLGGIVVKSSPSFIRINAQHRHSLSFKDDINRGMVTEAIGDYQGTLKALRRLLTSAYPAREDDTPGSHPPEHHQVASPAEGFGGRTWLLVLAQGLYHPCDANDDKVRLMADAKGTVLFYSLSSPPMLLRAHPLTSWCRSHLHALYRARPGPDLSPIDARSLKMLYLLYRARILLPEELSHEESRTIKMAAFLTMGTELGIAGGIFGDVMLMASVNGGRDLWFVMEEFVRLEPPVAGFSAEYWTLLPALPRLLPTLAPRERAFVRLWCRLAAEKTDTLFGCDSLYQGRHLAGGPLLTLMRSVELIYVTIERFGEGGLTADFMRAHVLVYHVITHMWRHQPDYFAGVRGEDEAWARAAMRGVTTSGPIDEGPSDGGTRAEDCADTDPRIVRADHFRLVRVERDPLNLYRCVAALLLVGTHVVLRSRSGILLTLADELHESAAARHVLDRVGRMYESEAETGRGVTYTATERSLVATRGRYVALLGMAAVAALCRRQVHVYEPAPRGRYRRAWTVAPGMFTDSRPVSLLLLPDVPRCDVTCVTPDNVQSPEDGERPYYALLVPKDFAHSLPSTQDMSLIGFTPPTPQDTDPRSGDQGPPSPLLEVLTCSAPGLGLVPWRRVHVGCFYKAVATHVVASLQCEPRTPDGCIVDPEAEAMCCACAQRVREAVARAYHAETAQLERVMADRPEVLTGGASERRYPSVDARAEAVLRPGEPAGRLELVAVSYLARAPVHLYRDPPGHAPAALTLTVPPDRYAENPPISLMVSTTDHCSLLLPCYHGNRAASERHPWVSVLERNLCEGHTCSREAGESLATII